MGDAGLVQRVFYPRDAYQRVNFGQRLGDVLVSQHTLSPQQLQEALAEQQRIRNLKLGEMLVEVQLITQPQLNQALELQARTPLLRLGEALISLEILDRALVIGAQGFGALIPLLIVIASTTKDGESFADKLIDRFDLTGSTAEAVKQTFGNGTGGGIGNGAGPGEGDGAGGGTPPRRLSGRLRDSDYPRGLGEAGIEGTVSVEYRVELDGRVTDCVITRSSGSRLLDETTCDLIEQRFRYRPAHDRAGRPVISYIVENHSWIVHDEPPERGD